MRTLLDTCVLSELLRPQGAPRVRDRVDAIRDEDLFVSVVTIGEIAKGVALVQPGKKRDRYEGYLLSIEQEFESRFLDVDVEVSLIWGRLAAKHRVAGRALSVPDGLIAATAIRHGMQLMTRNVKDFEETGALIVDPWMEA